MPPGHVRIRGDVAGRRCHTAKRSVSGVVRRGRKFGARGVRQDERKSKGAKQTRLGVLHKQGQPGNHAMLKRKHMNRLCGWCRSCTDAVGIKGKSRLPVGCRRYHTKAAPTLPSGRKEGPDGLAPRIPFSPWRHSVGRVLFEEGYEAVQIVSFPSPEIAAEELLLRRIWRRRRRWSFVRRMFGKRRACPLQGAVDRSSRAAEQRCGFSSSPTNHIAQQERSALARRQLLNGGNKSQLHGLARRIARLRVRCVVSDPFEV